MGGGEGQGEHRPPRPAHQGGPGGQHRCQVGDVARHRQRGASRPALQGLQHPESRTGPGPAGPCPPAPPGRRGAGPPPGPPPRSGGPRSARSARRAASPEGQDPFDHLHVGDRVGHRHGHRGARRARRRRRPRPGGRTCRPAGRAAPRTAGRAASPDPRYTSTRVGRSPGMLNGISRLIRPSLPYTSTLWSASDRIDTANDARRSPNSSTPAATVSTPETGIAPHRRLDGRGLAAHQEAGPSSRSSSRCRTWPRRRSPPGCGCCRDRRRRRRTRTARRAARRCAPPPPGAGWSPRSGGGGT